MQRTKTVINESSHGLIGLGSIEYDYQYSSKDKEVIITLLKFGHKFEYKNEQAKKIVSKLLDEDEKVKQVKQIAATSCHIPEFRLYESSRKKEPVFARYLVFWYATIYTKMSLKDAGLIFAKDHATALHGKRIVETEDVFLSPEQRYWKNRFINKLKDENLLIKATNK